jgi:hypothetical protein
MYDVVIGDPVREGRLRLDGVGPVERQLAIAGLVAIGALLLSLLFGDLWRRGDLLSLSNVGGRYSFLPAAAYPVTLVVMFVAWLLILWGALQASVAVRIGAAVLFLLDNPFLGNPTVLRLQGVAALQVGPGIMRAGYFAAPGLLVLSALPILRDRWPAMGGIRTAILAGMVASLAACFGAPIWMTSVEIRRGLSPELPLQLSGSIENIGSILIPLVLVSSVAVIEFSQGVSEATTAPLWRRSAFTTRVAVAGLVGFKLWIQLYRHASEWATFVARRPVGVVRVGLSLAFFVVIALAARRIRADRGSIEEAKERLIYGGALAFALSTLIPFAVLVLAEFLLAQTGSTAPYNLLVRHFPTAWLQSYGDVILWGGIALFGGYLMARKDRPALSGEVGVGLLLIGTWVFVPDLLLLFGLRPAVRGSALDLVVSIGAAGYLAARWRSIDAPRAVRLAVLVLFSWLVFTRGDFLSILGGFLGLPGILIVVSGVVFSLLADASFTSGDSRWFPRGSRPLLWVGYLVLSLTVANWLQVTHGNDITVGAADNGFFYLGIPLAAWLMIRRPLHSPEPGRER